TSVTPFIRTSSQRCTTSENSSTRQAGLLTSADAVKEGPVSRTSGEPEKQEGVHLEDDVEQEDGKCVEAVLASDVTLIVLIRDVEQEDGEGGTCGQDVTKQMTKEEGLLNATVEENGLVKSRMKAHTRHRPTCRQFEAGHGEGQLTYVVDVNPTVCDIV
ncbi:hypothetical protein PF010_g30249, partial [Phytophthora fragariae]